MTKRNLFAFVKANTTPISKKELTEYLSSTHVAGKSRDGRLSIGNASADPTILDSVAKSALLKKSPTTTTVSTVVKKRAKVVVSENRRLKTDAGITRHAASGKLLRGSEKVPGQLSSKKKAR